MWLGNKALRAGIAASLCIVASKLLNLKYPFFATLPAVMPLSTNLGETIKSGGNRMIGSAIGALVGIILALIQPSNSLLIGIGIVIIIYLCKFINWENSASIACLIFISIMVGLKGETAWFYSLHRLLDTLIGIAITTAISSFAFSINIHSTIIKSAETLYDNLFKAIQCKTCLDNDPFLDILHDRMENLSALLKIYKEQFHLKKNRDSELTHLDLLYKNFQYVFAELSIINSMEKLCLPNAENTQKIYKLFNCKKQCEKSTDDKLDIVYNYHLERLLEGIVELQKHLKK